MQIKITDLSDIEAARRRILEAALQAKTFLCNNSSEPIEWLKDMKFKTIGFHPHGHEPLNLIEQVNQTFTYLVALKATQTLLELHPNFGGYLLAPGAHASQALDIMSIEHGLVGAECFAAVDPKNNGKLKKDLYKLRDREERNKYVFFSSPLYPSTKRIEKFEQNGIQVWSLDF